MAKRKYPEARIFSVDTRFHRLARRGGGVTRERAIEKAKAEIEETKAGFDQWLDTQIGELSGLIKKAGAQGAKQSIERASFRSRELRDAAATLGFDLISFIADSLCAVLDSAATGGEYHAESVECHMDALSLARRHGYRHLKPEQVPELTNGLNRVAELASM